MEKKKKQLIFFYISYKSSIKIFLNNLLVLINVLKVSVNWTLFFNMMFYKKKGEIYSIL